jgi:hypothetical protein
MWASEWLRSWRLDRRGGPGCSPCTIIFFQTPISVSLLDQIDFLSLCASIYIGCPTTYQTRHFFNNSKTNEDIATKQTHTTDTHYINTLQTHTTDTHYIHTLQTHTTDTHYRHTLQAHTLQTHSSSFLTQRTYSCSNLAAISSLVLELLKKCRVW